MEAQNDEVYEQCIKLLCDLYKNSMQQKFRDVVKDGNEGVDKAMSMLKETMANEPEKHTTTIQRLV